MRFLHSTCATLSLMRISSYVSSTRKNESRFLILIYGKHPVSGVKLGELTNM
jgi:hypothetical protein